MKNKKFKQSFAKKDVKAVLCDLDNTLFDFVKAKLEACSAVTEYLGTGERHHLLRYFLRDTLRIEDPENIKDYMIWHGVYSQYEFLKCVNIYTQKKAELTVPYPHVQETIKELYDAGIALGIVTDSLYINAKLKLGYLGLDEYFSAIVTTEMVGTIKPEPDIFKYALKKLDFDPEQVLFVGDSIKRDIKPAQLLGMQTAYAEYGDRNMMDAPCRCHPDYTLADISELISIVL